MTDAATAYFASAAEIQKRPITGGVEVKEQISGGGQ